MTTERSRLIQRASYKKRQASSEVNHFDVSRISAVLRFLAEPWMQIILLLVSVALDAIALILVSIAKTPKQAIISELHTRVRKPAHSWQVTPSSPSAQGTTRRTSPSSSRSSLNQWAQKPSPHWIWCGMQRDCCRL